MPCTGIDLLQSFSEEFVRIVDIETKIGEEVHFFGGVLDICHHETAGEITVQAQVGTEDDPSVHWEIVVPLVVKKS